MMRKNDVVESSLLLRLPCSKGEVWLWPGRRSAQKRDHHLRNHDWHMDDLSAGDKLFTVHT